MAEPAAFPVALWVRCLLDRVQPAGLPALTTAGACWGALSRAGTVACRTWASQVQPTFSAGGFVTIVYATSTSPTGGPGRVVHATYQALQASDARWVAGWNEIEVLINPNGLLIIGGSDGDSGQTGRKLVMDYYGPHVPVGGSALFGKDLAHIDRAGPTKLVGSRSTW